MKPTRKTPPEEVIHEAARELGVSPDTLKDVAEGIANYEINTVADITKAMKFLRRKSGKSHPGKD